MRKRVSLAANAPAAAAVAVLGHLCTAHVLLAQDSVTIDVQDCVKLESPRERFDCYERHASAASPQKAAAPAAPAAPSAAPAAPAAATAGVVTAPPPAAPVQIPLTPAAQPAPSSSAGKTVEQSEPPEVVATITAVRETVPSSYVITLDNGQVWSQSYPEPYGLLHPGQRVTLRASKWGTSYHLSVEGQNGFIQVKRVQ